MTAAAAATPPDGSARGQLAAVLRTLRGAETVTEVARRLGVTRQTLLDLENGRSNPTLDRLDRLAEGYGVRFTLVAIGPPEVAAAVTTVEPRP